MDELISLSRKAANAWRGSDTYHQAAVIIDSLCDRLDDVEPVVYGKWIISPYNDDGFNHHMCSQCETDAPFYYIYVTQYDEGLDGEWFELGEIEDDIVEFMGKYCHECGAKMLEVEG